MTYQLNELTCVVGNATQCALNFEDNKVIRTSKLVSQNNFTVDKS